MSNGVVSLDVDVRFILLLIFRLYVVGFKVKGIGCLYVWVVLGLGDLFKWFEVGEGV